MKPRKSFHFTVCAAEKACLRQSWYSAGRDLRRRKRHRCWPQLVVMRWFVCMPVAWLDGLRMWAWLCENQLAVVWCVCVCVRLVSPDWGACVSGLNSVLSARFSTLPAAVKRVRPSLPPPRGLISFFILSAIQLDFLRGHRGQGPFTWGGMSRGDGHVCKFWFLIHVCTETALVCFMTRKFKIRTKKVPTVSYRDKESPFWHNNNISLATV